MDTIFRVRDVVALSVGVDIWKVYVLPLFLLFTLHVNCLGKAMMNLMVKFWYWQC